MIDLSVILPLGIGVVFYFSGWYMQKKPAPDRNAPYGFKTPGSLKSQKHWDFAQQFGAKKIRFWSIAMMFTSVPMYFSHWEERTNFWVAVGMILLFFAIPIFQTEAALDQEFGEK